MWPVVRCYRRADVFRMRFLMMEEGEVLRDWMVRIANLCWQFDGCLKVWLFVLFLLLFL